MAVKVKVGDEIKLLPLPGEIEKRYMPKTGGTFTGDIQVPAKRDFVLEKASDTFPATEGQLVSAVALVLSDADKRYAAIDHGHELATSKKSGFLPFYDKVKLDSIVIEDIPDA